MATQEGLWMSAGREPPRAVRYLVVGAGVHGLSTAWHLARGQRARGAAPEPMHADVARIRDERSGGLGCFTPHRFGRGDLHPTSHSPFPWS